MDISSSSLSSALKLELKTSSFGRSRSRATFQKAAPMSHSCGPSVCLSVRLSVGRAERGPHLRPRRAGSIVDALDGRLIVSRPALSSGRPSSQKGARHSASGTRRPQFVKPFGRHSNFRPARLLPTRPARSARLPIRPCSRAARRRDN